MIADLLSNKNLNPIVTKLIIRNRELNISFIFITQSFFAVPKNNTDCIPNRLQIELQQIAFKHMSDIDLKMYCKTIFFLSD